MDVAKVNRDVAHVAYFGKCFKWYVASIFEKIFHLFHTYVAGSVLFGYRICFTHMLRVFYLDDAYVSHMLQQYVSNVSSVSDICCIHMFHAASVSRGHGE